MEIVRSFAIWFIASFSVASAAPLVGVNFGVSGDTSPTNWTLMTAAGTANSLMDTNGASTAISLTVSAAPSAPLGYTGTAPLASTIPSDASTLSNLQSNFYNSGGTLTAAFSGLTPNAFYSVYAIGIRFVGTMSQTVAITGSGTPLTFTQTGAANSLFINGSIGSSSQTLESYALTVQASGSGTITIQFTAGSSSPSRYNAAGVALSSAPVISPMPAPSSMILILTGLAAIGICGLIRREQRAHL